MDKKLEGWILDERILPNAHLFQGDLINFAEEKDPLRMLGIVVTADCDLEQKKHAGLVTLIPVINVQTILEKYLLIESCERFRDEIFDFAIRKYDLKNETDQALQIASLREKITNQSDSVMATAEFIAASFVLNQINDMSVEKFKLLINGIGKQLKAPKAYDDQIKSKGDVLVLPSLEGLGFGFKGKIAWVRHIWQVPQRDIAMRTSEVSRCPGQRVARLDSPYRYRLTQLLSQVFSDIGLPESKNSFESDIKECLK